MVQKEEIIGLTAVFFKERLFWPGFLGEISLGLLYFIFVTIYPIPLAEIATFRV